VAERGQTNTKVVIGVLEKRFFEKFTSDVSLSMKLDQYTLGIYITEASPTGAEARPKRLQKRLQAFGGLW